MSEVLTADQIDYIKHLREHEGASIDEDNRTPCKQRRTAREIYRELVKLGYQGSERTIRAYAQLRKQEMQGKSQNRLGGAFSRLKP